MVNFISPLKTKPMEKIIKLENFIQTLQNRLKQGDTNIVIAATGNYTISSTGSSNVHSVLISNQKQM